MQPLTLQHICACQSAGCNVHCMGATNEGINCCGLRVKRHSEQHHAILAEFYWLTDVFFFFGEPCTLIIDGTVTSYIPNEMEILRFLMMQGTAHHLSRNRKRKGMNDFLLPRQRVIALMLDGLSSYHIYVHVWNVVSSATYVFLYSAMMVLNNWCDRQQYLWQHFCISKYTYKAEAFLLYHETRLGWVSIYVFVSTHLIKTFVEAVEWSEW